MPTPTTSQSKSVSTQAVVFRAKFRQRGYSDARIEDLRAAMSDIAAVRLRGQPLPEAGGSAELWAVLEFVGVGLATGAVRWAGGALFKRAVESFTAWLRRRDASGPFGHELKTFTFSCDDVDIEFCAHRYVDGPDEVLAADAVDRIPEALSVVFAKLPEQTMREQSIEFIRVPLICYDPTEAEFVAKRQGEPAVEWQVGRRAHFATDSFNSESGTFSEL